MLPPELDTVTRSYHRCLSSAEFLDSFYAIFLAKSEEIAEKFRTTDFVHQKRMLRESLLMMVMYNLNSAGVEEDMTKLAERHSRRGVDIPARLYDQWLDSLCEALQRHDPEYTAEIADRWRAAMQPGIDFLVSRY